jgi:5-methyltetrahydrofolate--homocysteine methyltransferase
MSDRLRKLLAKRPWLLADGATGTNFFARGLEHGEAPEVWNLERPEEVIAHYQSFIDAGSDIILTNSFGGTRNRLKLHKMDDRCVEINKAAAELAREAAKRSGREEVIIAGSMGPTGDLFEPLGPLTVEAGAEAFAEQARGLAEGGVDVLWIETLSSVDEVKAAVQGAATTDLPLVLTLSFDTNGRTMMGVTPADLVRLTHELHPHPLAFGGNCGTGASELMAAILNMGESVLDGDVLVAKSNCGIPEYHDGQIVYTGTPKLMADYARLALDSGVRIIGGCCGTTPEHVRAMRSALLSHTKGKRPSLDAIVERLGPISKGASGEGPLGDQPPGRGGRRRGGRRGGDKEAAETPRF